MNLKEYLKQNKMSQADLSSITGIAQPLISLYVNYKMYPSIGHLQKIIKATNGTVNISDFVDNDGNKIRKDN